MTNQLIENIINEYKEEPAYYNSADGLRALLEKYLLLKEQKTKPKCKVGDVVYTIINSNIRIRQIEHFYGDGRIKVIPIDRAIGRPSYKYIHEIYTTPQSIIEHLL